MPVIPPPMPNPSSTSTVPKIKLKEPNLYRTLPKLTYGGVLFGKTIYSGEYLGQDVFDYALKEITKSIEYTVVYENNKKGISNWAKFAAEL